MNRSSDTSNYTTSDKPHQGAGEISSPSVAIASRSSSSICPPPVEIAAIWTCVGRCPQAGESAGFEALVPGIGKAIGKPGRAPTLQDFIPRAAQEMLAVRLARCVGFTSIPYGVLSTRLRGFPNDAVTDWPVYLACEAFPEYARWSQVIRRFTPDQITQAARQVAKSRVFDTWIACQDRKADHVLIRLHQAEVAEPVELAFVDYAFSCWYSWQPGGAEVVVGPYLPELPEDRQAMEPLVSAISGLSVDLLHAAIYGIPKEMWTQPPGGVAIPYREIILAKLVERQKSLAALMRL